MELRLYRKDKAMATKLSGSTYRKMISIALGLCFVLPASFASDDSRNCIQPGKLLSIRDIGNEFDLACSNMHLRLGALSPDVLRIRYSKAGEFPQSSYVVQNSDAKTKLQKKEDAEFAHFSTESLQIDVSKKDLRIRISNKNGDLISEDALPVLFQGNSFQVSKSSPLDEHFFGLGDKSGPLDHRNQAYCLWNTDPPLWQESTDPMYKSVPFLLSLHNGVSYGIYLDNTFRSVFDLCKNRRDTLTFSAEGGPLDYYFFYGPSPKKVIQSYTQLVGRMPLPPLFSLGYQQSRGSYVPDSAVREVATELRKHQIPCDVIYLDGDYKQDSRPFTIDRKKFPDFSGLVHELAANGFKTVISMDPYIAKFQGDKNFEEGAAKGYFLKKPNGEVFLGKVWTSDTAFADFTRPEVRSWWGSMHKEFVGAGVRGIWDDMNEPALFNTLERTLPLNTVHQLSDGRVIEHREVHNIFAMENTHATYDGLCSLMPNLRPFILTRSGFAGSQRYAATWTGDNTSSWNHMRISVPQLLNLGVSGFCFAGSDIGGFNGFSGGPSAELLTRWMQLGAFNPLYRNHSDGVTRKREPWVDGPGHEAVRKKFIEMRYRLMPYIYSAMEECSRTGLPLMRPMYLEFPTDKSVETCSEQFMFGADILVAPKLWEIAGPYGATLPAGNEWIDFNSNKVHKGGNSIEVNPALAEMPIFVRAGSILPEQPVVQNLSSKPDGPLELRIYQGASETATGHLYLDDGETMNYQNKEKSETLRLSFSSIQSPNGLDVEIKPAKGSYKPWFDKIQIVVLGLKKEPKSLSLDGQIMIGWQSEENKLTLPAMAWSPKGNKIQVNF